MQSLRSTGRDTMEYRDGDRALTIYTELQGKGSAYMIPPDGIVGWNPPYDRKEITQAQKEELLRFIESWFRARNISYAFG